MLVKVLCSFHDNGVPKKKKSDQESFGTRCSVIYPRSSSIIVITLVIV